MRDAQHRERADQRDQGKRERSGVTAGPARGRVLPCRRTAPRRISAGEHKHLVRVKRTGGKRPTRATTD